MIADALSRLRLLNLRELRNHWVRTTASTLVVAVSAMLLVAVLGIAGSVTGSIDRLTAAVGGQAELEVSGITDSGLEQSLLTQVAAVPGVAAAVPLIREPVTANSRRTLLLGVDANAARLDSDLQRLIRDRMASGVPLNAGSDAGPDAVIAGPSLGVVEGERFPAGAGHLTAAMVVDGPAARRLNAGFFVIAPLASAQRITGRQDRLDSILLRTEAGADVSAVRSAVADAVGGRAVVATPSLRAAQTGSSFTILLALTLLAASASLVAALFLSYNAMSIAVAQRRPLISTLRALGGRRRTIVSDLLAEAGLLGLVGGLIGSVCGVLLGSAALDRLPATLVQSVETRLEWVLAPYVVPLAVGAAVVASVAAAALAARQVHSVAPAEAMTPLGAAMSAVGSYRVRIAAGALAVLVLATGIVIVVADLGRVAMVSLALVIVGGLLLCLALSPMVIRAVAAVTRWFGGPGVLGAAGVERAPRRMWVALMTVVTAVTTAVAVSGATADAVDSTVASYASVHDADIWIRSTAASEYPTSPLLPDGVEAAVWKLPGVAKVVGGQMAFVTVGDTRIIVSSVAAGAVRGMSAGLSEADLGRLLDGDGVVLTRDLARQLRTRTGQQITLQTPTGAHTLPVLGLASYFSGLTGIMAIGLQPMQQWFLRPGVTELQVTVTPGTDPAAIQSAIRDALPAGVYVYSAEQNLAGLAGALDQVVAVVGIVAWIVVAVCALSLLSTLMLSVLDRRREIGALRAIGASRGFTVRSILAEAAGLGIVGGTLGLIYGQVIQYLLSIALTRVLSIDVAYRMSPLMAVVGLAALGLCLLGALPPAVRASRLKIVQAIGVE